MIIEILSPHAPGVDWRRGTEDQSSFRKIELPWERLVEKIQGMNDLRHLTFAFQIFSSHLVWGTNTWLVKSHFSYQYISKGIHDTTLWPLHVPMVLCTLIAWVRPEALCIHGFQWQQKVLPGLFLHLLFQNDIAGPVRKKQMEEEEAGTEALLRSFFPVHTVMGTSFLSFHN